MRRVLTTGIVLFLFTGVWLLWSDEERVPAATVPAPGSVAAEGRVTVKPDQRALLSAEIAGRIEKILVDNLSPVQKGQILAVQYNADLEQRILQTEASFKMAEARYHELSSGYRVEEIQEAAANVKRAESELELARRNQERDGMLLVEEVISQSRYDAVVAERKMAAASLKAAEERHRKLEQGERKEVIAAASAEMMSQKYALESLKATYEKTILRSPLDGIVIRRYLNVSEFADVAAPILEVANLSEMIVEGEINEMDAGEVKKGMKALVTSDAFPDQQFQAQVYEVSAALRNRNSDPEDPSVIVDQKILPVKVRFLQDVPLKLGMRVDLKIIEG